MKNLTFYCMTLPHQMIAKKPKCQIFVPHENTKIRVTMDSSSSSLISLSCYIPSAIFHFRSEHLSFHTYIEKKHVAGEKERERWGDDRERQGDRQRVMVKQVSCSGWGCRF